jgi:hypothetical protein
MVTIIRDGKVRNDNVSPNVENESQLINESKNYFINKSNNISWKRKLKCSNIISNGVQTSFKHFHVDNEFNDLKKTWMNFF